MQPHLIHVTWLAASTALASAAAFAVGAWNLVVANVDPESVLLTAGGASSLLFIWYKVWTDSRATDTTVALLKSQCDRLVKENEQLLLEVAQHIEDKHQLDLELTVLRMQRKAPGEEGP